MRAVRSDGDQNYSDVELIHFLKENKEGMSVLYKKHKVYCLNFMKSMYKDHEELKDIYHDAVIVFYEKVNTPGFELTCSIQTYLNTVCRNQILKKINHSKRYKIDSDDDNNNVLDNITDTLEELDDLNNTRIQVMKSVLKEMKLVSSKCYEIMKRFWYMNHSMDQIASGMDFSNADSAKSQKAKCQKDFKMEVYKRLML
jgi:RNA polymerase sigma factor (sigma-70 family)